MARFKKLDPQDLVPMDEFCAGFPVRIDLAYARADNALFGERIYRKDARLWLHKDLAALVRLAASLCREAHGSLYILHDGLRTVDAQARMLETACVKANPQWIRPPGPLLSTPGKGGHPRGMAIDISLEGPNGEKLDMGTAFDFLAQDSSPPLNPAHRAHEGLSLEVRQNRAALDRSMQAAADRLNLPLLALPEEWWDFRFPRDVYEIFAPLAEADLPAHMRLMDHSM